MSGCLWDLTSRRLSVASALPSPPVGPDVAVVTCASAGIRTRDTSRGSEKECTRLSTGPGRLSSGPGGSTISVL